ATAGRASNASSAKLDSAATSRRASDALRGWPGWREHEGVGGKPVSGSVIVSGRLGDPVQIGARPPAALTAVASGSSHGCSTRSRRAEAGLYRAPIGGVGGGRREGDRYPCWARMSGSGTGRRLCRDDILE